MDDRRVFKLVQTRAIVESAGYGTGRKISSQIVWSKSGNYLSPHTTPMWWDALAIGASGCIVCVESNCQDVTTWISSAPPTQIGAICNTVLLGGGGCLCFCSTDVIIVVLFEGGSPVRRLESTTICLSQRVSGSPGLRLCT